MIEPIHIIEIDGLPLRFFASPLYSKFRQADLPWHSADDLRTIIRLPLDLQALFRARMKSEQPIETIATSSGITMIAPFHMGQGMLKFMQYRRKILSTADRRRVSARFHGGTIKAMTMMTSHLSGFHKLMFALSAMETGT